MKNPKPIETNDAVTELVDAPQTERELAQARARACSLEVQEILEKHQCRIMPHIDMAAIEPVGLNGNKIQVEASFWIAPLPTHT